MDADSQLLDFVKAISDVERLRVIGALTRGPARAAQVAERLDIPLREALNHLAFLAQVGVVRVSSAEHKQDETYDLESSGLEQLSRRQFAGRREVYYPAPGLNKEARKVLAAYLNADGSLKQIPFQSTKLRIILEYLVAAFAPGTNYTEKEVNTILRRFHMDVASLRRSLIDTGRMQRESDGSRYWRSPSPVDGQPS
jgi:hypothetical protein